MSYELLEKQENNYTADDSYKAYGLMLEELEAALEQIAAMRAMVESFDLDAEAAIQNQIEGKSHSTPNLGREEEIATKIEQSLTNILARLEAATSEQEFERILGAADEYLQSLTGKLGKSTNRKLLEKLFVLEVTLQTIREQLQLSQRQAKEKQNQQPQTMLQALQKNVLAQILEAAKNIVQSRMKEILQSAERLANLNTKLAAQKQPPNQQALNAQAAQSQNATLAMRLKDLMRSLLESSKTQTQTNQNPAILDSAKNASKLSQLLSGIAERANRLVKPANEALLATQRLIAMQAILTGSAIAKPNPADIAIKAQDSARAQQMQVAQREGMRQFSDNKNNIIDLATRQSQVKPTISNEVARTESIRASNESIRAANDTQQIVRESQRVQDASRTTDAAKQPELTNPNIRNTAPPIEQKPDIKPVQPSPNPKTIGITPDILTNPAPVIPIKQPQPGPVNDLPPIIPQPKLQPEPKITAEPKPAHTPLKPEPVRGFDDPDAAPAPWKDPKSGAADIFTPPPSDSGAPEILQPRTPEVPARETPKDWRKCCPPRQEHSKELDDVNEPVNEGISRF